MCQTTRRQDHTSGQNIRHAFIAVGFLKIPNGWLSKLDNRFGNLEATFLDDTLSETGDFRPFSSYGDIENELLIKCQSGHERLHGHLPSCSLWFGPFAADGATAQMVALHGDKSSPFYFSTITDETGVLFTAWSTF